MAKKFKFKSNKSKEKWHIFTCGDLQNETLRAKGPHLEIFGNREMILEGCMGVFEYSDSYLKLKLQKGTVTVCGTNFDITAFEGNTITVKGNILSLEFCV